VLYMKTNVDVRSYRSVPLRMRTVSGKICGESSYTYIMFIRFFFENRADY
jgi:hypothetical protein